MGDVILPLLFFIAVAVGLPLGLVALRHEMARQRLARREPDSVDPSDDLPTALGKARNAHLAREAARLLGEIHSRDEMVPFLTDDLRNEVATYLKEYYHH